MNKKTFIYVVICVLVIGAVYYAGFISGLQTVATPPILSNNSEAEIPDELNNAYWRAWQVLDERNINSASTTVEDKIYGSIEGLAASYDDPYTVFFPPKESKMFEENIAGNFGGVGMEIGKRDGQIIVVSPLKDSPAERTGVKAGDAILLIGSTSTQSMSVDEAVSLIRGEVGTKISITFLPKSDSSKPVERTIAREVIQIPTISYSLDSNGVYVIKLYSFSAQSYDLFSHAMREFNKAGTDKLIIDLRGNPGGYLDRAWDIASLFVPFGKTVVIEDFGGKEENRLFYSKGYNSYNGDIDALKIAILVDEGSASASEILAGALKEHGIAKLVGTKTFGKGSVQELVPITSNTSLKVTIASWLTPSGHNLSKDGLEPDYKVEITSKDIEQGKDPQMEKAVELLKS